MKFRLRKRVLTALLLASTSTFAYGEEAGSSSDAASRGDPPDNEIIVTAQRRAQSVMEVPLAITALSGDALADKGVETTADLASVVPNLQISSSFGATQPNFSLRGISVANEYNSNQASPVGVYIDDVYIAARTSHAMGMFDMDHVEVLRGPQGTLFGRNTTGGAINFITASPSLHGDSGYAELGYGNFNDVKAQAAIEDTVIDGQLGFRLAVNFDRNDGTIHNVFPGGKDLSSVDNKAGRLTTRWAPNDDLDIKIRAYGGKDDGTQAAVFGLASARQGLGFFDVDMNPVGDNKTNSWGVAADIAYTLTPSLKFTSISSVDGGGMNLFQNADGSALDVLLINWRSQFRQASEEARFNYDSSRIKLVGGLYYGEDSTDTTNRFNIGSVLGPGVNGGFYQHYRQDRESYAAFAQGDINLTDQLVMTLGARYTVDLAQYKDGQAFLFAGNYNELPTPLASTVPCAGVPGTCAYNPNAVYAIDGHNNAPTGRAALSYTFEDGMLAYLSYNRGYRSGAFNGGGYTSSSGITYIRPEEVNAYEVGLKGHFLDRKLTLSAAAFYDDYSDQQVQDTRPGPVSFLVNAPSSKIYGTEVEGEYRLIHGLSLHGSVGYLNATYDQLTLQGTDLSGNSLPFAPKITLQGGFDWTLYSGDFDDVRFSPSVTYSSRQYFSPFNAINAVGTAQQNSELEQGAYAKVNANLTWIHEQTVFRAWVNNLFDRKTLSYGLDLRGAGFPYNFLVPSTPRTFGISARINF